MIGSKEPSSDAAQPSQSDHRPEGGLGLPARLLAVPGTSLMLAAAVVVTGLAEWSGDSTSSETLLAWGAVWRVKVHAGEWWRLVTSAFPHVGLVHLVWNVAIGFRWSEGLERRIGTARFLVLYLFSAVVGSSVSVLGHDVVAAGASGALFGVIGGRWVLEYRSSQGLVDFARTHRSELAWTVAWFILGSFGTWDNYAHLGGLLAGSSLTVAWVRAGARSLLPLAGVALLVPLGIWWIPPSERASQRVAQALEEGRWTDAEAGLDELEGNEDWVYATRCWLLFRQGRLDELERLFEQPHDDMARVLVVESDVRRAQNRLTDADKAASRAIDLDPNLGEAYLARFRVRMEQRRVIEASADLRMAEQRAPADPGIPLARLVEAAVSGREADARRHLADVSDPVEKDFARGLMADAGWSVP